MRHLAEVHPWFAAQAFLIASAALLALAGGHRRGWWWRAALIAAAAFAALVPAGRLPLSGYAGGALGELSVTAVLLLACAVAWGLRGRTFLTGAELGTILATVAAAAAILYPSALGVVPWDAYRLGFRPAALLVLVLGLSVKAWAEGKRGAALVFLIPVAAYNARVLESDNLWDYLMDPALAVFAWGWALYLLGRAVRKRSAGRAGKFQ